MEHVANNEPRSLYQRLGGADGIGRLVDDLVQAHMENPAIKQRFLPSADDPEHLRRVKGHLCTFLCAGTGGTEGYTGRSMPEAHRGMNISAGEYMAALDDILMVLEKHGIDEQTRKDMLMIAFSIKSEIVDQ